MTVQTLPALFISHGSPMLALDAGQVSSALQRISHNLPKPQAIVVLSAHWQEILLEVSTATRPKTWHDFQGFPESLAALQYPAAGHPILADEIIQSLQDAGFEVHANHTRPRDHGVWMPLLHMYPDATVPVIQLSLPKFYSAKQIYALGQALAYLRKRQVLLIGSGSITHNLAELSWEAESPIPDWAAQFRNTVVQLLQIGDYESVLNWKNLPYIRRNHPTLEHFFPLFFAMGAGLRMSLVHSSFTMGALGMDIYRFD